MQSFIAAAALSAFAGVVAAADGPAAGTLVPTGAPPAGCELTFPGTFEITVVKPTASSKRSINQKRAVSCDSTAANPPLVASLTNGVLTDAKGRIGGIVANGQFQFDGPPSQAGTIYNGGFSVCTGNSTLALGSSTVFYQCLSGDFYNLYDVSTGAQCSEVAIEVLTCASSSSSGATQSGGVAVTQSADGQPSGGKATQIADGQIQAASAMPVSQISDGQIQFPTATPVAQIADGQLQVTSANAVAQITDGQIQATTAAAPVTQISDGQVQAATATPVAQIADGQIQATNATTTPAFTGAAVKVAASSFGLAAAVVAFFL